MEHIGPKERARRFAEPRCGRISVAQLSALGAHSSTIRAWTRSSLVVPVLPRVYAFAGAPQTHDGALWEAVLWAGPGASLTGVNGAWKRDLLIYPDATIEVSTPRDVRSRDHILTHQCRAPVRDIVNGFPIAPLPQLMLDLAAADATPARKLVRRALATLDYQGLLDADVLLAACRKGRPGSAALKRAIAIYDPRFAFTNGPLEEDYLIEICEKRGVPKPDRIDVWIEGIECDAVYDAARVIVQLDGAGNHGSPTKKLIDHEHDMRLRAHGWTVLRYSWELVHARGREVARDITAALASRRNGGPA